MFAVMKELVRQKYTRALYPSIREPSITTARSRASALYPGGGGYAGLAFNVAYTKAMLQAALSG